MIVRQSRSEAVGLWPVSKFPLLALYLAFDHSTVVERVASLGPSPALAAYLVLFAGLTLALVAAGLIRAHVLRIACAAVLACASLALHSYEWSTGSPLVYEAFETMVASRGDAGDAFARHGGVLVQAAGAALILFTAIALPPGRLALPFGLGWLAPLATVIALAALLYLRGGEGTRALPAPFTPLAHGTIMATLRMTEEHRPRQPVRLSPGRDRMEGDIVLVIDESVAGNYLDINHPDGVRSGLAEARPGLSIANFGLAASVANCSLGSNRTLRFGGTRDTYRLAAREMPSIWAYARAAGLRTVYLDGQRTGGDLQNGMTPAERAEIDEFRQLDGIAVPDRDPELARLLSERLGNGIAEFILVNKVGAHFPVADKFPPSAAVYRPVPPRGRSQTIADIPVPDSLMQQSDEDWRRYRNAYRNTLVWGTGGFFDRLLPSVAGSGAVIVYTADHGQDLHEHGGKGETTHCSYDPRPEEGAVPLVVISDQSGEAVWQARARENFDGMSHFRIFPTLLALMGYPAERTEAFYGPTLMSSEPDPLTFTPTYNASLGRDPDWSRMDRSELAAPPVADYSNVARVGQARLPRR